MQYKQPLGPTPNVQGKVQSSFLTFIAEIVFVS